MFRSQLLKVACVGAMLSLLTIACSENDQKTTKANGPVKPSSKLTAELKGLWEVQKIGGLTDSNDPLMGENKLGLPRQTSRIQFEFKDDELTIIHQEAEITFLNVTSKVKVEGSQIITEDTSDQILPDFQFKIDKEKLSLQSDTLLSVAKARDSRLNLKKSATDTSEDRIAEKKVEDNKRISSKNISWELVKVTEDKRIKTTELASSFNLEVKALNETFKAETSAPVHNHSVRQDKPAVRCLYQKINKENRIFLRFVSPKSPTNGIRQRLTLSGPVNLSLIDESEEKHFHVKSQSGKIMEIARVEGARSTNVLFIEKDNHCTVQLKRQKRALDFNITCSQAQMAAVKLTNSQSQKDMFRVATRGNSPESKESSTLGANSESTAMERPPRHKLQLTEDMLSNITPAEVITAKGRCYIQTGTL